MTNATVRQLSVSSGGVPKHTVPEAVLTPAGIVGDAWNHPNIHGGPLQAVLLLTAEGIDELVQQGFPLFPGAPGENITTLGPDRRSLRSGQRYRIGAAMLQLTKLREPCNILNKYGRGIQSAVYDSQSKAGHAVSPGWGLSGFYASVIEPGTVRPGDPILLL